MKEFTSTARKDGRWWVVQCDQVPGALSQVARLDQAEEAQREAISFVADLDPGAIKVVVRPEVERPVSDLLIMVRAARERVDELSRATSDAMRTAALELSSEKLSMRDIGAVLGISHQRVQQLIASASERSAAALEDAKVELIAALKAQESVAKRPALSTKVPNSAPTRKSPSTRQVGARKATVRQPSAVHPSKVAAKKAPTRKPPARRAAG